MISGVDESAVTTSDPAALVAELALAKATAVAPKVTGGLVLGADSVLDLDGVALGKPADVDDARRRWTALAGRDGVLRTGQAVLLVADGAVRDTDVSAGATTVRFGRRTTPSLRPICTQASPFRWPVHSPSTHSVLSSSTRSTGMWAPSSD